LFVWWCLTPLSTIFNTTYHPFGAYIAWLSLVSDVYIWKKFFTKLFKMWCVVDRKQHHLNKQPYLVIYIFIIFFSNKISFCHHLYTHVFLSFTLRRRVLVHYLWFTFSLFYIYYVSETGSFKCMKNKQGSSDYKSSVYRVLNIQWSDEWFVTQNNTFNHLNHIFQCKIKEMHITVLI